MLVDCPSIQPYVTTNDIDGKNRAHSSERKGDTDNENKDKDNNINTDDNDDDDDDTNINNNDNNTELSDNNSDIQNLKCWNTAKHSPKLSFPKIDRNISSKQNAVTPSTTDCNK